MLWYCQPFISAAIQMKVQLYSGPINYQLNWWLMCSDILNCSDAFFLLSRSHTFQRISPHLTSRPNTFSCLILPHVPTPVHPTSLLTFFQANTFSLTENRNETALLFNKRYLREWHLPREKRLFPSIKYPLKQRHNTIVSSCLKFQMLQELTVQCINVLYTNAGIVTSRIVDTKAHNHYYNRNFLWICKRLREQNITW